VTEKPPAGRRPDSGSASKNDQCTRYAGRVIGTELHNPSFAQVAEVFGAKGIRAEPSDLGKAVQTSLKARRPTVIEADPHAAAALSTLAASV